MNVSPTIRLGWWTCRRLRSVGADPVRWVARVTLKVFQLKYCCGGLVMSSPEKEQGLATRLRELTQQIETLWHAVDDLREQIFAELRQWRGEPLDDQPSSAARVPFQLTSMPLDPCDRDFHKKVNTIAVNGA